MSDKVDVDPREDFRDNLISKMTDPDPEMHKLISERPWDFI